MGWQTTLTEIRGAKLTLARLDPRVGMPVRPPQGADAQGIAAVERRLGRALPPSFRAFLAQHDGFPQLYQGINLLTTRHLARGTYLDLARMVIEEPTHVAPDAPALFPFGVDATGESIFAFDPAEGRENGELAVVVWMNEVGVRLESFTECLELVHEMLLADILERRGGAVSAEPQRGERARLLALDIQAA